MDLWQNAEYIVKMDKILVFLYFTAKVSSICKQSVAKFVVIILRIWSWFMYLAKFLCCISCFIYHYVKIQHVEYFSIDVTHWYVCEYKITSIIFYPMNIKISDSCNKQLVMIGIVIGWERLMILCIILLYDIFHHCAAINPNCQGKIFTWVTWTSPFKVIRPTDVCCMIKTCGYYYHDDQL